MKEGGKRKIIATPDKAYGEEGTEYVPPNTTLIYELELVSAGRPFNPDTDPIKHE